MKINWKIRFRNKAFWITLIPAVILLVRQVCALLGIELDLSALSDQLVGIVETVFMILVILGVVVDPTTDGALDSDLAMMYGYEDEHEEFSTMGEGVEEDL